jgi:hypothetical protein
MRPEDQAGSQTFRCDRGICGEIVNQHVREVGQACGVDVVAPRVIYGKSDRRAAKNRHRTLVVAALHMGDADRELGKCLPQCLLVVRTVLPRGLEHFVRVEGQAPIQQILSAGQCFGRRQLEVVRNAGNAFAALRKRLTEGVAGTLASGPTEFVAIAVRHKLMMSSTRIHLESGVR